MGEATRKIRLVGLPGAVAPGGCDLTIKDTMDGKAFSGVTKPDGSFDIQLTVYPLDPVEVRAECAGARSDGVLLQADSSDPSVSTVCDVYPATAQRGLAQLADQLNMVCSNDDDCVAARWTSACTPSCTAVAMSRAGYQQLTALQARLASGVCKQFSTLGCSAPSAPCAEPEIARCINGQCEVRAPSAPALVAPDQRQGPEPRPRNH